MELKYLALIWPMYVTITSGARSIGFSKPWHRLRPTHVTWLLQFDVVHGFQFSLPTDYRYPSFPPEPSPTSTPSLEPILSSKPPCSLDIFTSYAYYYVESFCFPFYCKLVSHLRPRSRTPIPSLHSLRHPPGRMHCPSSKDPKRKGKPRPVRNLGNLVTSVLGQHQLPYPGTRRRILKVPRIWLNASSILWRQI